MVKKLGLTLCALLLVACNGAPTTNDGNGNGNGPGDKPTEQKDLVEKGRDFYLDPELGCAACHGPNADLIAPVNQSRALKDCKTSHLGAVADRCASLSSLTDYISRYMPETEGEKCQGDCAESIAWYLAKEVLNIDTSVSCSAPQEQRTAVRRLNKAELQTTVNNVFGMGGDAYAGMEPDGVFQGFPTVGTKLATTSGWTDNLIDMTFDAVDTIVDGGGFSHNCGDNATCVVDAIADEARLLFRRDLTNAEKSTLVGIYDEIAAEVNSNPNLTEADATKGVLMYLLSSPKFMFVNSVPTDTNGRELTSPEIADRLALALTGAYPDSELIDLALQGELTGAKLDAQIDRLLDSSHFDKFVENFTDGWLIMHELGKYLDSNAINMTEAQRDELMDDMRMETRTFLRHIFKNNLPLNEIILADYTFVNGNLARHYGINGVSGNNFVKVDLPANSGRRGIMTQGSILALAAQEGEVSYVDRGKMIVSALMCEDLVPDDNVLNAVDTQITSNATQKQKIQDRKASPACAGCHNKLDPIGWVFTSFDIGGKPTGLDPDGDPLSTAGELFGENFDDAAGMAQIIADQDIFSTCFASKFLIHSAGRIVKYSDQEDRCRIDDAITGAKGLNGVVGSRDLLKSLLTSDIQLKAGTRVKQ